MEIRKLMRVARKEGLPPVEVKTPEKYENRWKTEYPHLRPNK